MVCVYVPCYKILHKMLWKSGSKRDISQNFFLVFTVGNLKIDLTKSTSTPRLGHRLCLDPSDHLDEVVTGMSQPKDGVSSQDRETAHKPGATRLAPLIVY